MEQKNILVTAIGSFSALCVISKLRQNGYRVIGCDIYPGEWHAETLYCNQFYQAPLASSNDEYISFLKYVCERERISMIIPLTDIEIDVINKYRIDFISLGIIIAMPSQETLRVARDKYLLSKYFDGEDGITTVETIRCGGVTKPAVEIPAIAKPVNGRSSEGLLRLLSMDDLNVVADNPNYIVQPLIDGPIITVDYIRDNSTGNDYSIPRQELLRTKNGAGTTVEVFKNVSLSNTVSAIGKKLRVNGCINMEFIKNDDIFYLIDINPRFSAGVAFSCQVGYDMITAHINCHFGKEIPAPIDYRNQIITKSYSEITTRLL